MFLQRVILFILFLSISYSISMAQEARPKMTNDSLIRFTKDSLNGSFKDATPPKKKHIPRIATRRSLILPGWGQAYNGEYWKIPIVYLAIGIPAYTYFYNNSYYKKTNYAYGARYLQAYGDTTTAAGKNAIKAAVAGIDPQLINLDLYSLASYRNIFRHDRDYSILWFAILWGVNVADATVFAHLKDFDVSRDLSLHITPTLNSVGGQPTIGLVFNSGKPTHKLSSLYRSTVQ